MSALDCVPCPCCGWGHVLPTLTFTEEHPGQDAGVWSAVCPCGCEWNGCTDDPRLRAVLTRATARTVDPEGDDPSRIVRAVLRGLGLTDADIVALAGGARLRVDRDTSTP